MMMMMTFKIPLNHANILFLLDTHRKASKILILHVCVCVCVCIYIYIYICLSVSVDR